MKKVISFILFVIAFALLISCRSNRKCIEATNYTKNPSPIEVAFIKTEVA